MAYPQTNEFTRTQSKILAIRELTPDVREITFERPKDVHHIPGQFVGIMIDDGGEEPGYRSYSLLSDKDGNLQIVVKLVEGGRGSTYLFGRTAGDMLDILYPLGYFGFPEKLAKHLVFVATGTGIVPLLALLESLPPSKEVAIDLLFGVRYANDLFYQERIEALKQSFPNIRIIFSASRDAERKGLLHGRVTDHISQEGGIVDAHAQYFMCGSGAMIADVATALKKAKVPRKQIFFEDFNA